MACDHESGERRKDSVCCERPNEPNLLLSLYDTTLSVGTRVAADLVALLDRFILVPTNTISHSRISPYRFTGLIHAIPTLIASPQTPSTQNPFPDVPRYLNTTLYTIPPKFPVAPVIPLTNPFACGLTCGTNAKFAPFAASRNTAITAISPNIVDW